MSRRHTDTTASIDLHGTPDGLKPLFTRLLETWSRTDVRPDSVQVPGETLPHCGCPPVSLVWLSSGLRSRRAPREEWLERGLFCSSSGALLADNSVEFSQGRRRCA